MFLFRGLRGILLSLLFFLTLTVCLAYEIQLLPTEVCKGDMKDLREKGDGMCDYNPWKTKKSRSRMPLPAPKDKLDDLFCKYISHQAGWRDWEVIIPNDAIYETFGCGIAFLDNFRGQCGAIRKWTCEYVGENKTTALISFSTNTGCWLTMIDWGIYLASGHQIVRPACRRYLDPLPFIGEGDPWDPSQKYGEPDIGSRYKWRHRHPPPNTVTAIPPPPVDTTNPWVTRFSAPPMVTGRPTWLDIDYNSCSWYRWRMGNGGIKRSHKWLITVTQDDRYDKSGCGRGFLDNIRGECGPVVDWACLFTGPDKKTAYMSFATFGTCTAEKVESAIYKASYHEVEMICLHDLNHFEDIDLDTDPGVSF